MTVRVLLGGGGTAGHVSPALATAEALRDRGAQVAFVGTARGLEASLVPRAGWPFEAVPAAPFRRGRSPRTALANLRTPLTVLRAARRLARRLRAQDVDVACVFGGYVSGPLALAARLAKVPLVIHEQNAVPGLANRLASRWAASVASSVPGVADRFAHPERVVVTGNPVRVDLRGGDRAALRAEALEAFGLDPGRSTLLVFGGSLGARRLNDAVVGATPHWGDPGGLQVLHGAGRGDGERAQAAWDAALAGGSPLSVRCLPFFDRMDLAYALADLVVARSGASTIAELTVLGLPSVLVPYPHAVADEQTANARALVAAGAAVMLDDADLDGAALAAACAPLLSDPRRRERMSEAARSLGVPDAADRVADLVLTAASSRARTGGRTGGRR